VIVGGMLVGPVMLLLAVPALRMIFLGGEHQLSIHHPNAPETGPKEPA
jgi:heavy metal efflux system protein